MAETWSGGAALQETRQGLDGGLAAGAGQQRAARAGGQKEGAKPRPRTCGWQGQPESGTQSSR